MQAELRNFHEIHTKCAERSAVLSSSLSSLLPPSSPQDLYHQLWVKIFFTLFEMRQLFECI